VIIGIGRVFKRAFQADERTVDHPLMLDATA
jgi:hypothetical protein